MIDGLCPECEAGKHGNCIDQAYDATCDVVVPCRCFNAEHDVTKVRRLHE